MPFAGRCPRAWGFLATAIALITAAATPTLSANRGDGDPFTNLRALDTAAKPSISMDEGLLIEPIEIPFLQKNRRGRLGNGISMESYGEPKSGTTWTERVITELALQLCGSSTNTWCKMGGLIVIPNRPDPSYQWEMLHADTGKLYMHFNGRYKHGIPGLDVGEECNPHGREHVNGFAMESPCKKRPRDVTRESLLKCLPITSEPCAERMPSRDPTVRRTSVVFRDPREVVISEHRMRIEVYLERKTSELDPFIYERFETIVSWQFIRWIWHTTFYENESHVMFYEDLQASPEVLADLAAFIGLNCSKEHAVEVLNRHKNQSPHGNFDTYDLPLETIEYMNATMSKLLPEEMLARYGLSTTSL
ncbi:unnamed protein product [Ascophyllum nodosum]